MIAPVKAITNPTVPQTALTAEVCYRALATRDARFDGRFFTGVRSTGIFCRPICPARRPKFENCEFFGNAAQAQQAGYRPCLRCHPELSPRLFQQVGTEVTVARALRRIAQGALDQGSVTELAAQLGVSDRRLRQLFATHVGTSPGQAALARRILFAKQLIHQTDLSLTEIAIASGFNSLRRFNDAIRKACGHPPSDWRRPGPSQQDGALRLRLAYSPPYDWVAMMAYWQPRQMVGVEAIEGTTYRRVIQVGDQTGWVQVQPIPEENALQAEIHLAAVAHLGQVVERLRRMFDLEADGAAISAHLQTDPMLRPLVARRPGLRLPGCWEPFELAVRVILGQQVSVAAATTVCNRLIEQYGTRLDLDLPSGLSHRFPTPQQLLAADLPAIGITRTRAMAIRSLAAAVSDTPDLLDRLETLEQTQNTLCPLPGIGPWTAQYVALRGLQIPDAFPTGDLGLLRAISTLERPMNQTELTQRSEQWRPWRAYAVLYLWTADLTPPVAA